MAEILTSALTPKNKGNGWIKCVIVRMTPDVKIATFEALEPARQLIEKLSETGIQATVQDETALQKNFLIQKESRASVHVLVDAAEAVKAEQLVLDLSGSLNALVQCPQCRKSRVVYPQYSRKYIPDAFLLSIITRLGFLKPQYFCESCSWLWSPDGKPDAPTPPTPEPPDPSR